MLFESIEIVETSYLEFLSKEISDLSSNSTLDSSSKHTLKKRVANAKLALHDGTDIQKKYARKMEGLSRVRDGSASTKKKNVVGNGYPLEGSLIYHQGRVYPAILNLYSYIEDGYKTEKLKTKKNLKLKLKILKPKKNEKNYFIRFDF